jgi:chitin synthase
MITVIDICRLFVAPLYTGVLFSQSMILNRRRNDLELKKSGKGGLVMSDANSGDTTSVGAVTVSVDEPDTVQARSLKAARNERPIPVIYGCATMWHETENEMMQLLKSLFR